METFMTNTHQIRYNLLPSYINNLGRGLLPPIKLFESGQSNVEGSTPYDPSIKYQQEFSNVDFEGAPLKYGENYHGMKFGFDLALAKEFNQRFPDSQLFIEKDPESGTGFPYWLTPANTQRLVDSYGLLNQRAPHLLNVKKAFLWMLNVNPSVTLSEAETVKDDFETILSALETAHGAFDKIIIGVTGIMDATQYEYLVRTNYKRWLAENKDRGVEWDLSKYTTSDGLHYNDPSKYEMGLDLLNILYNCFSMC